MRKLLSFAGMVGLVAALGLVSLAASRTFTNDTGGPVTGIRITFSEMVWITGYDKTVFPTQDPVGVVSEITFSGGQLESLGQFQVTWSEEYATVLSHNWLSGSGSSSRVQYPTAFGINYAHPGWHLAQGEQSQISNPAVLDSLRGREKSLAHLGEIYQWLHRRFTGYSAGGATIGKATVDQLLASRRLGGCHDYALVYAAVARELGYPALMVDTANVEWIKRFQKGEQGPHVGHVFVEVFLIDKWVLVDPTGGPYVENGYDPTKPAFREAGGGDYGGASNGYYAMWKGIDTRACGVHSNEDNTHAMDSFARQVDVTTVTYLAYVWKVFAR